MSGFAEYREYDGLGLAELVRTKQVSAADLVEEAVARIEARNPAVNAVIRPLFAEARAAAQEPLPEGSFAGVPLLLKDLICAAEGVPTSCGTRILRDVPQQRDSEMVRRFRAAGFVIVGKTNLPEFGLLPYTEPEAFGPTNNPWSLERTAGGSSGGSAASVAVGMVPIASGGDGGGSIRIPASCCGLFGLKPSRARTPTGPDFGELWRGFVQEHVLTRSVRDSAAVLDAVAGPDVGAPYWAPPAARPFLDEVTAEPGRLRIAFTAKPLMGHDVHPDCLAGLDATVSLLEELGHEVVEAAPPMERESFAVSYILVLAGETRDAVAAAARAAGRRLSFADFETGTAALALLGQAYSAGDFAAALNNLQRASRRIAGFFERYDVLLTPTLAQPPVPTGSLQPSAAERRQIALVGRLNAAWLLKALRVVKPLADKTFDFMPYTAVFNVTGQPAMSVPLHWNAQGLPIGMQFAGRYGAEAVLFRLAGQLERARPWFAHVPPAFAG